MIFYKIETNPQKIRQSFMVRIYWVHSRHFDIYYDKFTKNYCEDIHTLNLAQHVDDKTNVTFDNITRDFDSYEINRGDFQLQIFKHGIYIFPVKHKQTFIHVAYDLN